jgi:hypothetical protein
VLYIGVIALEPDVFSFLFSLTAPAAFLSGALALARKQLRTNPAGFDSAAV